MFACLLLVACLLACLFACLLLLAAVCLLVACLLVAVCAVCGGRASAGNNLPEVGAECKRVVLYLYLCYNPAGAGVLGEVGKGDNLYLKVT